MWEGENGEFLAGTVVRVEGGRVKIVYNDGDECSYDMKKEVRRREGDGSEDEEEGNDEEEEGDEEEGEKEEDEGVLD